MNIKLVIRTSAILMLIIAGFLSIPMLLSLYYHEKGTFLPFFLVIISMLLCSGLILRYIKKGQDSFLSTRDSFIVVTFSWIIFAFIGALPSYFSNAIPSFTDAYFEAMSGFTTTGATILNNIEILPKSILFWRALTHWLGGMGIVVLAVAILPLLGMGGLQLISVESPGPSVDRLTSKITETAKILWMMYLGYTILETILLLLGGMTLFDALTHTFATVSTGGFSVKNSSVGHYNSAYIDTVITIFMLLSGLNFALQYKLFTGNLIEWKKNNECKVYLGIALVATLLIAFNVQSIYHSFSQSLRYASFQVASILTTTGFTTVDYEKWPYFSQMIIFLLMCIGGCSGSTSGGVKVIRIVTLFKQFINELKYLLHPRGVFLLVVNGKVVKKDVVYAISGFCTLYVFLALIGTLLISTCNLNLTSSLSTALSMLGNIGPGFDAIGPSYNVAFFPAHIKWFLSFLMMVGRLELYSVLVLFMPIFWKR